MNNELFLSKIKEICPKAKKYEFYKNAVIYKDENDNKHVVKENKDDALKIYNYLNSRGFSYLPKLEYLDKEVYIYKYEEDLEMPKEQRMSDLIKTSALLHNKTVYYKDTSVDEVKELYEFLSNKIVNTYNYYDDIMNIIKTMSFKGGVVSSKQNTIEGKIVQDADRLDALGAIGIARTFAYGGSKNRLMYDPNIDPMEFKSLDEVKNKENHTINHFYEKLLKLKDLMNTETAKVIANKRHEFMEKFLCEFYNEWNFK